MKKFIYLLIVLLIIVVLAYAGVFNRFVFRPTASVIDDGVVLDQDDAIATRAHIETIVQDLIIPWDLVFLPDNTMVVSERPGTLRFINSDGTTITTFEVGQVNHHGEGGLLGMTLHPQFEQTRWIYVYMGTATNAGVVNRVERYVLNSDLQLADKTIIIDDIPGAIYHDGGRIRFGPDGLLYITTGDATEPDLAQDLNSLAGKILRIDQHGNIPSDNPFGTAVYSYGHRNPQGLAWDDQARLWSTEHGRSGIRSGFDELNLIVPGGNYGWPVVQGDEVAQDMIAPVAHSGPDETWAPASLVYHNGSLFFGGLRGQSLYEARIVGDDVELIAHFREAFGRIRTVVVGPDQALYIMTSNRDGRGSVQDGDDKIIRIDPDVLTSTQ